MLKPALIAPNVARGATPIFRRKRRQLYASRAMRAMLRGDTAKAARFLAFSVNNGARLNDLKAVADRVDDTTASRWMKLLNTLPQMSVRVQMLVLSRKVGADLGGPGLSEEAVNSLVDAPDVLSDALIAGTVVYTPADGSASVSTTYSGYGGYEETMATFNYVKGASSTSTTTLKKVTTSSTWRTTARDPKSCLLAAKKDKQNRPLPPDDAKWGSVDFQLWVNALCNEEAQDLALEAEAEGLMAHEQQWSGFTAMVGQMVRDQLEGDRQRQANLKAAFAGMPIMYPSPHKNEPGASSLYVLPPNYAVPGLPVSPASGKGKWAEAGPPLPPGAVPGQIYTPPVQTASVALPPQQVVDPATGQLVTVTPSATQVVGTPTAAYPGGPVPATYPMEAGQTYPGYTPLPPTPVEDTTKKKRKKKSSPWPMILGLTGLGVAGIAVLRHQGKV